MAKHLPRRFKRTIKVGEPFILDGFVIRIEHRRRRKERYVITARRKDIDTKPEDNVA